MKSYCIRQRSDQVWPSFNQEHCVMADKIISSDTHDAHMTVKDHIADGWVATLWIVARGAPKGNEPATTLDTFFDCEDTAWHSVETLALAKLSNLK
jgi:hypothetical protein